MSSIWLPDVEGRLVRLSDERREHIFEHPEMSGLEKSIGETLGDPEMVMESLSDPQARLYYRHYSGTPVGDKFLCVVVKLTAADAFVITARSSSTGSRASSARPHRIKSWKRSMSKGTSWASRSSGCPPCARRRSKSSSSEQRVGLDLGGK
jgi:hypothetical protein